MSASEVAYFGLNRTEHDMLETAESAASRRVLNLLFAPKRLLATILLVNNFVNIGIVILLDFISKNLAPEDAFQYWGGALQSLTQLGSVESWQRGIGFGIAQALLDAGCSVALCARGFESVQESCERLSGPREKILGLAADVGVEEDVRRFFDEVISRFGQLDILVNLSVAKQIFKDDGYQFTAEA